MCSTVISSRTQIAVIPSPRCCTDSVKWSEHTRRMLESGQVLACRDAFVICVYVEMIASHWLEQRTNPNYLLGFSFLSWKTKRSMSELKLVNAWCWWKQDSLFIFDTNGPRLRSGLDFFCGLFLALWGLFPLQSMNPHLEDFFWRDYGDEGVPSLFWITAPRHANFSVYSWKGYSRLKSR